MSCGLAHRAFIYGSPDEFVAAMAPFVREALERDDPVVAATTRVNIDALAEDLGADGERVHFEETTAWCTRPYDRLQEFRRMIDALPAGRTLHAMGEPVWSGSDAMVRQWARYESVINAALADARMESVCLYDGAALPDRILDYAERTHPQRVDGGAVSECAGFVAPDEFQPGAPDAPPPEAVELALGEVSAFRQELAGHARGAGLAGRPLDDFVLAANEVATNALIHGRPPLQAHVWVDAGELVCRIPDGGVGLLTATTGWLPPKRHDNGGWGLPLARQVCDVVEIGNGAGATTVSLHLAL